MLPVVGLVRVGGSSRWAGDPQEPAWVDVTLAWAIMLTVGSILAILAAVFSAGDSASVAWPFRVLVFVPFVVFFATHRIAGRLRRRRTAEPVP